LRRKFRIRDTPLALNSFTTDFSENFHWIETLGYGERQLLAADFAEKPRIKPLGELDAPIKALL
jgi:hypothetical protein